MHHLVYQKTGKGLEEISSRAHSVPARMRSLLILIDGRSTAREIIEKARHISEAEAFLHALAHEGFITAANDASMSSASSGTPVLHAVHARHDTPADSIRSKLDVLRHYVTEELVKLMGRGNVTIMTQLEQCDTLEQFLELMPHCHELLRHLIGPDSAKDFMRGVKAKLAT